MRPSRRRKDGTRFEISLSISPVRDATGQVVAAAGFARDISERKVFQTAAFQAAIVENSDDAIVSKDLDGTILSWNDAATRMYGYTAEEAIGQPIDIVIPESLVRQQEELKIRERIARGERIQHYETIRRRKDGTRFEMSLSLSPVRDATGQVVAAAGFARDISERKVFQTAQYQAAIVENSDDAIVSEDLDGKILSWNEAATQMYGYTAEEAIGQPIDIVIPDDPVRQQEELDIRAQIARGERIQHYETTRRRKDGTRFEISLSISPVRDATGQVVAAAGFARDISERKVFQTAQYQAAIVENSDDAIVSKDLDGKILSWNEAATRMYGYTAEEAIGQPIDIVIPDDPVRQQEEQDIRARIARGERIQHYETIRRRMDGTRFEISLSLSPVRDATGQVVAAAGFARDISERKVFQTAAFQAAIVENSDDAIVSEDLDGTILSWNEPPPGCTATRPRRPSASRSTSSSPTTRCASRKSKISGPRSPGVSGSSIMRRSAAARTAPGSRSRCPSRRCGTPPARWWRRPGSPATSPSGDGCRTSATVPPGFWRALLTSARTTLKRPYTTSSGMLRRLRTSSARTRTRN